jgi:hypothetical protein
MMEEAMRRMLRMRTSLKTMMKCWIRSLKRALPHRQLLSVEQSAGK